MSCVVHIGIPSREGDHVVENRTRGRRAPHDCQHHRHVPLAQVGQDRRRSHGRRPRVRRPVRRAGRLLGVRADRVLSQCERRRTHVGEGRCGRVSWYVVALSLSPSLSCATPKMPVLCSKTSRSTTRTTRRLRTIEDYRGTLLLPWHGDSLFSSFSLFLSLSLSLSLSFFCDIKS